VGTMKSRGGLRVPFPLQHWEQGEMVRSCYLVHVPSRVQGMFTHRLHLLPTLALYPTGDDLSPACQAHGNSKSGDLSAYGD
jgi:hypothetical protein